MGATTAKVILAGIETLSAEQGQKVLEEEEMSRHASQCCTAL